MELSSVTIRVLLLFFPGVLCALVVDTLTVHRERTPVEFLTHAFALGMGSYLSLAVVRDALAVLARGVRLREPLDVTFFEALLNDRVRIAWGEIALAASVGVVLSCVMAAAVNRRLLMRFASRLNLTQKLGEPAVWSFVLNSERGKSLIVRDVAQDTVYVGTVEAFSETPDHAELFLKEVEVFQNSSALKLYDATYVYLARDVRTLVIEPAPLASTPVSKWRNFDA
jgi:Family of unknown function (DUF6338)